LEVIPLTEKDVNWQIKDYLNALGIFYFCPLQGLGASPGVSDFIGLYKGGRFLAIEAKATKGKVSDFQRNFLAEVERQGGIAIVAYSIDEVIKGLSQQSPAKAGGLLA